MDRSEVKAIVDEHIETLLRQLGISHWNLVIDYDMRRSDGDFTTTAECVWRVDYNRATISLDPDAFRDEAHVLEVLRHELFHLVLSPFTVFLNTIKPLLQNDHEKADMAENVWTYASEQAVINLERMHEGLTTHPAKQEPRPMAAPKKAKKPADVKPTVEAPTPTPQARKSPKPAARKAKAAKT